MIVCFHRGLTDKNSVEEEGVMENSKTCNFYETNHMVFKKVSFLSTET